MMINGKLKNAPRAPRNGTGVIELLISLSVGILVVSALTAVGIEGLKNVRAIGRYRDLQSDAVYMTDTIAYWVKQGENLTQSSPHSLTIRLPGGASKNFSYDAPEKKLMLDGVRLNSQNVQVPSASFELLARSARIHFTLDAVNGNEEMSVTTTATIRNYP